MSAFAERLRAAADDGRLRALDAALAEWCLRHGGSPPVALAMALASRALADGHSCLALDGEGPALPGEAPLCDADELRRALADSPLVAEPGGTAPLMLDGGRLYLHRYWEYETRLAERLRERIARAPEAVDTAPLAPGGALFDDDWVAAGETHWQAVAAAAALRHRFTVISGGPGTGKTYTVLRLIKLLVDAAGEADPPDIRLAAPTGKAAARMMASIREGLTELPDGERLRAHLPDEAATIHRLLRLGRGGVRPRRDRDNPLVADAVIVDEASMIDLPLMAKLADAVPDHARLILLGDRYQLASVESGSVLTELCDAAGVNAFSAEQCAALAPLLGDDGGGADEGEEPAAAPLADHVVTLQTSHRFHPESPIGRLAAAVNAGDPDGALAAAADGGGEIDSRLGAAADLDALADEMAEAYRPLIEASEPGEALAALDAVRLLTATRVGPSGSETLNRRIHQRIAERHDFDPERRWYHGRPVIVLHNDYRAGLFNGDTGVCLRGEDGHLRVWFSGAEGPRPLLPTALPEHETVYAMTVHKSQGSEFSAVRLLLPEADMAVLTRELVYTGITRARERLSLIGPEGSFRAAVGRTTRRDSGLAGRLGG